METDSQNKDILARLLSDGVLITLASAFIYISTYIYKVSYAAYFGIPRDLISVGLTDCIGFGAAFLGILVSLQYLFINGFGPFGPKTMLIIQAAFPGYIFSFYILNFYVTPWMASTHAPVSHTVDIIIYIGLAFVPLTGLILPLFPRSDNTGYFQRLSAHVEQQKKQSILTKILERYGRVALIGFVLVPMFYFGSIISGHLEAKIRREFLMNDNSPQEFILCSMDDTIALGTVDVSTKKLTGHFRMVKKSELTNMFFHQEKIGPLIN